MRLNARTVSRVSTGPASDRSSTRLAPAKSPGCAREASHRLRDPSSGEDGHDGDAERREEEGQHERRAPGRRAGWRFHRDVQPASVLEGDGGREPVELPMSVVVIVVPIAVVVVVVVVPIVVVPIVVVVEVPRPRRRHPDPLRTGAERGGKVAGNGGGPLAGPGLHHHRHRRQREARDAGARRGEHGLVQRSRRVAQQPHDRRRACDGVLRRCAWRSASRRSQAKSATATPLRDGEREQQQKRELAREASWCEPHPRSTLACEPVAAAPHGGDERRVLRVALDLAPQPAHLVVDRAVEGRGASAPGQVEKLSRARAPSRGRSSSATSQPELARGQRG